MNKPWLKIIGISEHAPFDMSEASISLVNEAEFVFGGKRHLKLLGVGKKGRVWPIPFSVRPLLAKKNKNVVVSLGGGGVTNDKIRKNILTNHLIKT